MPTKATSTEKPRSKAGRQASRTSLKPMDAIRLLKQDHREVKGWFKEFEKLDDDSEKLEMAKKICLALTVHAQIEEEIFYPAVRGEIDDDDLMDEAEVEHASAKQLIAEIQRMKPSDRLFDAKVIVLGEYVNHHVEEEESEMFPESRDSDVDLKELGAKLAARKQELMQKLAKN